MIDKLYELLAKVGIVEGADKILHWTAGFLIGGAVTYLFDDVLGFLVGFAFGLGKEYYDKYNNGVVDFFDFFFTLVAVVLSVILVGSLTSALYPVEVSTLSLFGVLAVYGAGIYHLFVRK